MPHCLIQCMFFWCIKAIYANLCCPLHVHHKNCRKPCRKVTCVEVFPTPTDFHGFRRVLIWAINVTWLHPARNKQGCGYQENDQGTVSQYTYWADFSKTFSVPFKNCLRPQRLVEANMKLPNSKKWQIEALRLIMWNMLREFLESNSW